MIAAVESTAELAQVVRAAMEAGDLERFSHLLDPDVRWGAPDDDAPECVNRGQVITWYRRALAAGVLARVTEVVAGEEAILVGLMVSGSAAAGEEAGEVERWQVLTVAGGLVTDIRGFENRAEAANRAGMAA